MSKIRIKNFGPIKEGYQENDGWIDVKKVTVFIGNQGSGKSTVAKVISTLTWLEKVINRGDKDKKSISKDVFRIYFNYHRLLKYFKDSTEIEYVGDTVTIKYNKNLRFPEITINESNQYSVPKIMYVPSERNLLYVIENAFDITNLPSSLKSFAEELIKGQNEFAGKDIQLPVSNLKYKYDSDNEISNLIGDDFHVDLLQSSSGFQSFVPLFIVSKYITDELKKGKESLQMLLSPNQNITKGIEISKIMFDDKLTVEEKIKKVQEIESKYLVTCFINIVEEPEQNLFPSSQQKILNSLLEFNNMNDGNKLIITTHSPYLINYLSIAIQAENLLKKINNKSKKFINKLDTIVPIKSVISASNVIVYQLDESKGIITKLPNPEGIPSDKNFLNQSLRHGNEMFDSLLEIEQEL